MIISVLITGVSGGGVGRQCIKALRLGQKKYKIIGTDINPLSLGLYSVDKAYLVPRVTDPAYIDVLLDICQKEKATIIIPGSEVELIFISEKREEFIKNGILPLINNHKVIATCLDKWQTYKLLLDKGFKMPKSYLPKDKNDIQSRIKYPVVIKPYVGSGGSRGIFIAQNDKELKFFIEYLTKQGASTIVQEYIGSADEEYTVGVLHDLNGKLLGSFALKRIVKGALSVKFAIKDYTKNQIYTISTGISQGVVDDYPDVRKYCERVAKALGSTGPINIQCRKVEDDIYIFEINPRFSGTTSIRALCGYNEPETLIQKHYLKKSVKKLSYKKGTILRDLENCYIDPQEIDLITEQGFIKNDKRKI